LHAPNVAERIYAYNPNAIVVILLRDPLQRAFSHYNMLVGLSRETRSFENVMKSDIKDYYNGNLLWYSCLGMSFYNKPVLEFKKLFNHVQIVRFENFIMNKTVILNNFFKELGLEPIEELVNSKTNTTRKLRLKWLLFILKKLGLKDYFSAIFSSSFKQKVFKMVSSSEKSSLELSQETITILEQIFKKESTI